MNITSKLAIGTAVASISAGAHAGTGTVTLTPPAGTAITFSNTDSAPASETFGIATFSGGAFLTPDSGNYGGTSAAPPGAGTYWSIGTSGANGSVDTGSVTFSQGLSQIGFEWGSPDAYNTITFYGAGGSALGSFTGQYVETNSPTAPWPLGDQSVSMYFNFTSSAPIYSATYTSSGNAFETANYSYVAAVPEAGDYAFMAGGLALLGLAAWRKRTAGKSVINFNNFA